MVCGKDMQMSIKLLGAVLIIIGCGGVGFRIAACYLREEKTLRNLIAALDYMECELQYRLTPLPQLSRQAASQSKGILQKVFLDFAIELEDQIHPDVSKCMRAALEKTKDIPKLTWESLDALGKSMGRFDMDGQLKGMEAVRQECRRILNELSGNRESRVRSYQTLGLCAGAAIAILFV